MSLQAEVAVTVGHGSAELSSAITVTGFDVRGRVLSKVSAHTHSHSVA